MYTDDRNAYRQVFFVTWQKYQKKLLLEPIEAQLIEVILMHPEYHSLLENPHAYQQQEFQLEDNPFFHMSLHLSIQEQIRTNRPLGINQIHHQLIEKYGDGHEALHQMMQCLAQVMWAAQQNGTAPSEEDYLNRLKLLSSR